jgi:hypothetical protein
MSNTALSQYEDALWRALEANDPEGWHRLGHRRWNSNRRIRTELDAHLGWFICPRAHALAHNKYVLDLKTAIDSTLGVRVLFHERGRYVEGPDPVFALGDLQ